MKLEELYDRLGEKLFHYLTIKLGSWSDAEDVLQNIFLRFSKYSIRWRIVRNVEAFVFRVARNEANRLLRHRLSQDPAPTSGPGLAEAISAAISGPDEQTKNVLSDALARLPDEQREIIVLKIFEELTFKEIASICNLSINTVSSRYRYAIAKLQSFLEGKI
jgi:RNA polymerase sigma-70 factor (ECF subfamily)